MVKSREIPTDHFPSTISQPSISDLEISFQKSVINQPVLFFFFFFKFRCQTLKVCLGEETLFDGSTIMVVVI